MARKRKTGMAIVSGLGLLGIVSGAMLYREARQQTMNRNLIAAIKRNDADTAIALLAQGADANAQDIPAETRSLWQILLDLVQTKHPPPASIPPALLVALDVPIPHESFLPAYQDTSHIIHALLQRGANVNVKSKDGDTPLLIAAEHHHWKAANLLLDRNVPVEVADSEGNTLLILAADTKQTGIVKRLVDRGARIDIMGSLGTALHVAAGVGDSRSVRLLLDRGAKVNLRDEAGQTPLHRAADAGDLSTLRCLLDNGATVNTEDNEFSTPLIAAASQGNIACVRLLLDRGADINVEAGPRGQHTPLMEAVIRGHLAVVKLLVARGANVNTSFLPIVVHPTLTSPLSYARESGRYDIVAVLKKAGAKR